MESNRNQIEEIKDKLDIAQVIEKYVKLKPAGKNLQGLCPFHQEKTPSFIVSPDIQRYKCFGCGKSGDIFNFIQEIENLDFPETLERLAKEAGITIQKTYKNDKFQRLEEINYIATKYYYYELKKDKKASQYLKERGFKEDSIKNFGIGYAPKYPKLLDYVQKQKKFSKQELLDSGLFTNKEGKIREKFFDRIMFPIRSTRGKVIGFSGRVLPGNDYGPKYMNSPETPIFHKKDNIFGQYESRQEIRKQDLVILCEGQTDVISAHQKGFKNIVAPLGTGLTTEQVEKLSKLTKNLLFFFDSDEAGQQAVNRGFKIASEVGVYPFAASPEPYKDIDELLQNKPKELTKKINKKQDAFTFLISNYILDKDLSKLEDRNKTENYINDLITTVKGQNLRNHYISQAQKLTKLLVKNIATKGKNFVSSTRNCSNNTGSEHMVKSGSDLREYYYIQYLTLLDDLEDFSLLDETDISDLHIREIYTYIKKNNTTSRDTLYKKFENNTILKKIIENMIFNSTKLSLDQNSIKKELTQLSRDIRKNSILNKIKTLNVKMAIAEDKEDTEESNKLNKEILELTKILNRLKDGRDI